MGNDVDELIYPFKFDSYTLTYSVGTTGSKWDGQQIWDGQQSTVFSSKSSLDYSSIFVNALTLWDAFSIFQIAANTSGTADIYAYGSNNSNTGTVGFFENDTQTISENPESETTYTRAEIAFNNDLLGQADSDAERLTINLHEIGHALGLSHPASDPYDTDYDLRKTVMTYNTPTLNPSNAFGDYWAITPMAYDIAALEDIYGSFTHNETSNTLYDGTSLGVNGTNNTAQTIVDTGAEVGDKIDLSGVLGSHRIDLHEAIDGSDVWQDAATIVNYHEYIYIARGSKIEKATGGVGADTIIGNAEANLLIGGDGNDQLWDESNCLQISFC